MRLATNEVTIAAPLPQQVPIVESASRFKLVRAGRRFGKTRLALYCGIVGHGPGQMHRGIVSGFDVAWVAPIYKNAGVIWNEDIRPRFRGAQGVSMNDSEHTLTVPGGGRLLVVSADNIAGIRGIGARLAGVIVDEAAWLNLGYALRAVIYAALMDNQGWLLVMSTTNSGWDGNAEREHPSYFNRLAKGIADGSEPEWEEFYGTAYDNPKLARAEVDRLVASYPEGSLDLDQEVFARLRAPGAGLAFPEWRDDVHVIPTREPPRSWKWVAAMDWGYRQGSYGLYALGPEGEVEKVWEFYGDTIINGKPDAGFKQKHARQAAKAIAKASEHFPRPEYIAADTQMWSEIGSAETLAEEFNEGLNEAYGDHAPPLLEMKHAANSRKAKKNLVHRYLGWKDERDEQGRVQPWCRPLLRIQQRCKDTIRTLKALPLDPNKPDDVDTDAEDHAYDETAFALSSRPPLSEKSKAPFDQDNQHPGFNYERREAKRVTFEEEETQSGYRNPTTYKVPR